MLLCKEEVVPIGLSSNQGQYVHEKSSIRPQLACAVQLMFPMHKVVCMHIFIRQRCAIVPVCDTLSPDLPTRGNYAVHYSVLAHSAHLVHLFSSQFGYEKLVISLF